MTIRSDLDTPDVQAIFRDIADQFPSKVPPDDYQFEFSSKVKLDYRDWRIVLKALQSMDASETEDTTAGSSARQPEALQAQGDDTTVRGVAPAAGVPLDKRMSESQVGAIREAKEFFSLHNACPVGMDQVLERIATAPSAIEESKMIEERHVPAPLSDCLRILSARHNGSKGGTLSQVEMDELEASAALLELAYPALRELVDRIEKCGASLELTRAVILCSDLRSAIGNRWNARDKYAEQRVRDELARSDRTAVPNTPEDPKRGS